MSIIRIDNQLLSFDKSLDLGFYKSHKRNFLMGKTYVVERKIEYWTSRQIEDVIVGLGHDVDVFPLSLLEENQCPADFIFTSKTLLKVFGIQYKTLYYDRFGDDYWNIDNHQYSKLINFDWIYYGLSEVKDVSERNMALHLCRFKTTTHFKVRNYQKGKHTKISKNLVNNYRRWGGFYIGLLKCDLGKRIASKKNYHDFLQTLQAEGFPDFLREVRIDIIFTDLGNKRTANFTS